MREIKFRLWSELNKIMLPPITPKEMCECALKAGKADFQDGILMQYTGLKDKNGIEIYEGDIVEVKYDCDSPTVHKVEWGGKSYPAFEFSPDLGCECNGFAHYYEDPDTTVEVIGNIHQNPELLK